MQRTSVFWLAALVSIAACGSAQEAALTAESAESLSKATTTVDSSSSTSSIDATTTFSSPSTTTRPTTTTPTTTTPTTLATPSGICDLVEDEVLAALAEAEVVMSVEEGRVGLPTCQYTIASGSRVQVVSIPAGAWAAQLAPILDQIEGSPLVSDEANARKMEEARDILMDVDTRDPCRVFSILAELQGRGEDLTEVVNLVPSAASPLAINGQRCTDQVYSSVQLVASDITDDADFYNRALQALDAVHTASIAAQPR